MAMKRRGTELLKRVPDITVNKGSGGSGTGIEGGSDDEDGRFLDYFWIRNF